MRFALGVTQEELGNSDVAEATKGLCNELYTSLQAYQKMARNGESIGDLEMMRDDLLAIDFNELSVSFLSDDDGNLYLELA